MRIHGKRVSLTIADIIGRSSSTVIRNALYRSIDEGGCGPIWVKIHNVHPSAFGSMRIHQSADTNVLASCHSLKRNKKHQASPSLTLTLPNDASLRLIRSAALALSLADSMRTSDSGPSPFMSTFRRMTSVAAGDRSFAITYLY
jgi:hypothetical protein